MRSFIAVLIATIAAGAALTTFHHLYGLILVGGPVPTLYGVLEMWLFGAIGTFFINAIVGVPVVTTLARFKLLQWPIVAAAGAAVGVAACALLSMLPSSDSPADKTFTVQLSPWLGCMVTGAVSAAVLSYLLRPGPNSTVEGDARKSSARPSP